MIGSHLLSVLLAAGDTAHASDHGHHSAHFPVALPAEGLGYAGLVLALPLIAMILNGVYAISGVRSKLPAWTTVACLGTAFAVVLNLYLKADIEHPVVVSLFEWINLSWGTGAISAPFGLYLDSLTLLWMLFVTGLGTLIALYASEYMESDVGPAYCRFFGGVSIFLLAMGCLVMGDNLLTLYLGWEGVGFASYMLIGYHFTKPSAVAAAKKAFIVNRIGDLGLALGIYLTWLHFGTLEYSKLFEMLQADGAMVAAQQAMAGGWEVAIIPFLLMAGAFGKSAQLPFYVWLPDAMEGPTPVSALIHAATMVTAGVYLLVRTFPMLELHPAAAPTVAWVGGATALLAATIGMAQYDIKRVMAYSTVSQLGYMFMGVGVLSTFGAAAHVFTHAFFKAVLFLTCGAIMHGFAGQLDLRVLRGLRHVKGWRIVVWTMFYASLCLAGFPIISSGYWSKDVILAEAFANGRPILGGIGLLTAGLTAYYTFRVWFRVCCGPKPDDHDLAKMMGDDHHGDDHHDEGHGEEDHHHHMPHAPKWAVNLVLSVISLAAIGSIFLVPEHGWLEHMVAKSSGAGGVGANHHDLPADAGFWADPHGWMKYVASTVGLLGMAVAAWLHLFNRSAADRLRATLLASPLKAVVRAMENKWYVDELYNALIRMPLKIKGHALHMLDRYVLDILVVDGLGRLPKMIGRTLSPLQNGVLQSYAASMAGGVILIALLILVLPMLLDLLGGAA